MLHIRRFQYPHGTASRLCATPIPLISTIPLSIDLLRLGIRFAVLEMIYARFSRIILSTSNTGGAVALSQNLVQGCAAKLSKTARTTKSKNPLTLVVVFHCVRLPLPPMFAVSTEGREYKRFAVHWLAAITIIGRKEEETHSTRMHTCGNSGWWHCVWLQPFGKRGSMLMVSTGDLSKSSLSKYKRQDLDRTAYATLMSSTRLVFDATVTNLSYYVQ